jgi:predicted DNA-binding transcriptional regulator AlpA
MPLLSTEQAADYCGLSSSFFNKSRLTGDGPVFLKLGRRVAYKRDDLDRWLESCRRSSTSQTEAA